MLRIEETESTLLPTPYGEDRNPGPRGGHITSLIKMLPTPSVKDVSGGAVEAIPTEQGFVRVSKQGKKHGDQLRDVMKILPTPTVDGNRNFKGASAKAGDGLQTVLDRLLPTPKGRDWKGQSQRGAYATGDALPNTIQFQDGKKTGMKLQPHFVEWMMGFPIGWLDLKPSETPKSRSRYTPSSKRLRKSKEPTERTKC